MASSPQTASPALGSEPPPPGAPPGRLTLQDVARQPRPGRCALSRRSAKLTADGARLAYLHSDEGSAARHLAVLDVGDLLAASNCGHSMDAAVHTVRVNVPGEDADGGGGSAKQPPGAETLEEQMRRERLRDLGEGLATFGMARLSGQLLWTCGPPTTAAGSRLWSTRRCMSCNRIDRMTFRQLSSASAESTRSATRGLADFVAQEEFDRLEGFWWSPDSSMVAFQEVVEEHVPAFRIHHPGADTPHEEEHRYPFAGAANPAWRLGIAPLAEGRPPVWLEHPAGWAAAEGVDAGRANEYLVGVTWMPDSSGLLIHLLSRSQQELSLHAFDASGRHLKQVHRETSSTWVNHHRTLWPLETMSSRNVLARSCGDGSPMGTPGFIFISERSGFAHLSYHFSDGRVSHPITAGEFVVVGLEGVAPDLSPPTVYFTATLAEDPTQQQLFSAPLLGDGAGGAGPMTQLSREEGSHGVLVHTGRRLYIDVHSSCACPEIVTVHSLLTGERLATLSAPPSAAEEARIASLVPPEITAFRNRDGVQLHAALFRPDAAAYGRGPYPTVLSVYGGPHVQQVQNAFTLTSGMREQFYRQQGYLVVKNPLL
eukprot:jgi/Tetstr1/456798/TSEL_043472.t1